MLVTGHPRLFGRWRSAGKRRRFRLVEEWSVCIACRQDTVGQDTDTLREFEGTIVIPKNGGVVYDGASVPLPWLVSCLSFGILRPLGILLTASIVHDYAYEHGYLPFAADDGMMEKREVQRDAVDLLFREMTSTVNRLPFWAFTAWTAVRLGWLCIKYNGEYRTGNPPTAHLIGFAAVAALGVYVAVLLVFG